jgi:hypothetical protein
MKRTTCSETTFAVTSDVICKSLSGTLPSMISSADGNSHILGLKFWAVKQLGRIGSVPA